MKNSMIRIMMTTAGILMIPLLGKWDWTTGDYIIMGGLIFSFGLAYSFMSKKVSKERKVLVGVVLLLAFLITWAELAVGLFGSPFAGN